MAQIVDPFEMRIGLFQDRFDSCLEPGHGGCSVRRQAHELLRSDFPAFQDVENCSGNRFCVLVFQFHVFKKQKLYVSVSIVSNGFNEDTKHLVGFICNDAARFGSCDDAVFDSADCSRDDFEYFFWFVSQGVRPFRRFSSKVVFMILEWNQLVERNVVFGQKVGGFQQVENFRLRFSLSLSLFFGDHFLIFLDSLLFPDFFNVRASGAMHFSSVGEVILYLLGLENLWFLIDPLAWTAQLELIFMLIDF